MRTETKPDDLKTKIFWTFRSRLRFDFDF